MQANGWCAVKQAVSPHLGTVRVESGKHQRHRASVNPPVPSPEAGVLTTGCCGHSAWSSYRFASGHVTFPLRDVSRQLREAPTSSAHSRSI